MTLQGATAEPPTMAGWPVVQDWLHLLPSPATRGRQAEPQGRHPGGRPVEVGLGDEGGWKDPQKAAHAEQPSPTIPGSLGCQGGARRKTQGVHSLHQPYPEGTGR